MPKLASILFATLLWPFIANAQIPGAYRITVLSADGGVAMAMNDAGQVVGIDNQNRPTMWSRNGSATLLPGNATQVSFGGINNDGTAVGQGSLPETEVSGYYQPLIWRNGGPMARMDLPGLGGRAVAINNSGDIIGSIVPPAGWPESTSGFLRRGDSYTYFQDFHPYDINDNGAILGATPGGMAVWQDGELHQVEASYDSSGDIINNQGWIAGTQWGSGYYATLWRDGGSIRLWEGFVHDMNDAGMVIGSNWLHDSAVVWFEGQVYVLDHLWHEPQWASWTLFNPAAINEAGEIAAHAWNVADGTMMVVLLSPVPEPAQGMLLLAGLALLGGRRLRPGRRSA